MLHYSEAKRFFLVSLSIILNGCYLAADQDLKSMYDGNSPPVRVGDRTFTGSDVVFDFRIGMPEDILHHCSPFCQSKFTGLPKMILTRSISFLFDSSYVLDDVLIL